MTSLFTNAVEVMGEARVEGGGVWCPPGRLYGHPERASDDHVVESFWIAHTPVTVGLRRDVPVTAQPMAEVGVLETPDSQCPVTGVSWLQAIRFCNRLSRREGLTPCYDGCDYDWRFGIRVNGQANGYRLPTTAEWEYAARCGTDLRYAGSDDPQEVGWFSSKKVRVSPAPCPVRLKKPNGWGLYDMSGNVWEMCFDAVGRLTGGLSTRRAIRGGSYAEEPTWLGADHAYVAQNEADRFVGFRLVRSRA